MIIHNFRGIKKLEDLELAIKEDIIDIFENPKPYHDSFTGANYYRSDNFIHYIMAEHDSEAGKKYNQYTLQQINVDIRSNNIPELSEKKFFTRLMKTMDEKVQKFIFN